MQSSRIIRYENLESMTWTSHAGRTVTWKEMDLSYLINVYNLLKRTVDGTRLSPADKRRTEAYATLFNIYIVERQYRHARDETVLRIEQSTLATRGSNWRQMWRYSPTQGSRSTLAAAVGNDFSIDPKLLSATWVSQQLKARPGSLMMQRAYYYTVFRDKAWA